MKPLSLAILLLFSTFYAVKAQKNYKPALLIKTAGDTVKGYINYKEWDENPKTIEFKASITDAKPNRYTPDMLRGFEVLGMDKYLSYIGNISADKNKFPELANNLDTTTVRDSVFLQLAYRGKPLSMFKQTDAVKTRFFISEANGDPVELKYYQYYINSSSIQKLKLFQGYLLGLAQKYSSSYKAAEAKLTKAEFVESDLFEIIKLINNDQATKTSGTGGSRYYAGVVLNQIITDFEGMNTLSGQRANSYIPSIDLGVDIFTNKYTQRFFLRTNLGLSLNMPHFKYQPSINYSYNYQFTQYNLSLMPQLIYNFYNKENYKVYVGVGGGVNYSVYGNSKYIVNGVTSTEDPYDHNHIWYNAIFKLGAFINKKVEIFGQFSPYAANTPYVYFSIRNSSYGAGVHYLFGK